MWIADPERMMLWNDKFVSHSRSSSGELHSGEVFRATLEMTGKRKQLEVTVEEAIAGSRIVLLYCERDRNESREVRETIDLFPSGNGTRVRRTIDLRRSGIPFLWRIAIEILHRVGKPQGTPMLEVLRARVEESSALSSRA